MSVHPICCPFIALIVCVCVSGTLCAALVLPEGCEHHDGCNEGDERGGVAHSVNLSERIEVTRLQRDKQRV